MKMRRYLSWVGAIALAACGTVSVNAAADIPPPAKRKEKVDIAQQLANGVSSTAPMETAINPFSPPAFGQPDPEELAAIEAAKAAETAALAKNKPVTEADMLQHLSERITPSGTVTMNGEQFLIFGQKKLRVGDTLTVTFDGKDYKVELTGIQRSTFSLRFNRAELTRRINP